MITSRIVGADGKQLKINGEGEIAVTVHTHPPTNEAIESLPFRSYFTNAGSNDLRVNGATTNVEFSINADANFDYWVKFLSIKLADASAQLDKFGNLTALTNGVQFEWRNQKVGSLIIHDGIKDNLEFFRLSNGGHVPQIIDLSGAGADAVIIFVDLALLFGNPWGLRLQKGSTDKLLFKVRDNLSTGIDEFNIIAYGTKI